MAQTDAANSTDVSASDGAAFPASTGTQSKEPSETPSARPSEALLRVARRVAFLGAHQDYDDAPAMLERELERLYIAFTDFDGDEEPDLTFCCGCREEIETADGEDQWVFEGAKYHKRCYALRRNGE